MEDVDSRDGVERDGDVEVEMAGFGVVDAEAVEEDEGLLEGGAADGEVGLNAAGAAALKVERGVLTEVVGEVVKEDGLVACVEGLNGPIGFGQWYRWNGGCDFDGLPDGRKRVALLSRRGEGLHAEQKRYGKQRFMD